jgi:hypothetical protein
MPFRLLPVRAAAGHAYQSPAQSLLDVEMPQIRRGLVLLDRHQVTVGAKHILLLPDEHVIEVSGAVILGPHHRRQARIALLHRPGPRECVIESHHLAYSRFGLVLSW